MCPPYVPIRRMTAFVVSLLSARRRLVVRGLTSLTHDREVVIKRPFGIHEPFETLWVGFHVITDLTWPRPTHPNHTRISLVVPPRPCRRSTYLLPQTEMLIVVPPDLIAEGSEHAIPIPYRLARIKAHPFEGIVQEPFGRLRVRRVE